ncbi:MAG TPA: GNAT family N-acetyltransferase [Bryobacteraceae bacterium]|nr:GNAT family N-acetyltransferase [Bryobacteraceae bacterium]
MYSVRPWTDSDTGTDREISQAIYPEYQEEPNHPAWFPAQQLGAPREVSSRYVAVDNQTGHRLAYATLWELRPRRYRFDLAVRPAAQRQGIATQLLTQITTDAQQLRATGLQARVRDDKPEALEFIRRRGFLESHRMGAYRIDFARAATAHQYQQAFTQLRDRGLEVTNLGALRERDPHYLDRFHQLYSAARDAWPDPDPDPSGPTPVPFERLKSWLDEVRLPDAFIIATHRQRYIAFTSFFAIGTAVHPEYRRQGIATLLKAGSIAGAQHRGLLGQTTSTASPAMQSVLTKLGYRRTWSEIRLIRELRDET